MRKKTAIFLVLAMIFSTVASPAFAAELSVAEEEIFAAEAVEAAEEAVTESEPAADLGSDTVSAEAPSAGGSGVTWGGEGKETVTFTEDTTLDMVTLVGDTTVIVAEGATLWVLNGISGPHDLTFKGPGYMNVQGLRGKIGDRGTDGVSGANGADGQTGAPGNNGSNGTPGNGGSTGVSGEAGTSESAGGKGGNGGQGGNGGSGMPGESGTRGTDGTPGERGGDGSKGGDGEIGGDAIFCNKLIVLGGTVDTFGGRGGTGGRGGNGGQGGNGGRGGNGGPGGNGGKGGPGGQGGTGGTGGDGNPAGEGGEGGEGGYGGLGGAAGQGGEGGLGGEGGEGGLGGEGGKGGPGGYAIHADIDVQGGTLYATAGSMGAMGMAGKIGDSGIHGTNGSVGTAGSAGEVGEAGSAGSKGAFGRLLGASEVISGEGGKAILSKSVVISPYHTVYDANGEKIAMQGDWAETLSALTFFAVRPMEVWGEEGKTMKLSFTESKRFTEGVKLLGDVELTLAEGVLLEVANGIDGEGFDLTVNGEGELRVFGVSGQAGEDGGEGMTGAVGGQGGPAIVCDTLTVDGGIVTPVGGEGGKGGNGGTGAAGGLGGLGGDGVDAMSVVMNGGKMDANGGIGGLGGEGGKGGSDGAEGGPGCSVNAGDLIVADDLMVFADGRPLLEEENWADVVRGFSYAGFLQGYLSRMSVKQDPADSAKITLSTANGELADGAMVAAGHRVTVDIETKDGVFVDEIGPESISDAKYIGCFYVPEDPFDEITVSFSLCEKEIEQKPVENEVKTEEKTEEEKKVVEEILSNDADQTESLQSLSRSLDIDAMVKSGEIEAGSTVVQSMDVKLKDVALNGKAEESVITFEIKPVITVKDGETVKKSLTVDNSYLKADTRIKVRVPMPKSVTAKYAKIRHISENGSVELITPYPEIVNAGTPEAYTEFEVSHFSTFEVGFTDEQYVEPVQPSWSGSSGASSAKLFTGVPGSPVTGTWSTDAAGNWHFATSAMFRNTWGYIVNPYAPAGLPKEGWFWFDWNGNMLNGWQLIGGKWYYLNPKHDGTFGMCQLGGVTPDGYKLNADGSWAG